MVHANFCKMSKIASQHRNALIRRLPFDWKNPLNYLIALSLQLPCIVYCSLSVVCDICFTVSSSYILMAFAHDVKLDVNKVNASKDVELKENLGQFIQFHSSAKQLRISHHQTDS